VKVVAVVRGPMPRGVPAAEGIRAFAVHHPAPDVPGEHPPRVRGVVTAWLDEGTAVAPAPWAPDAEVDAYAVAERVQIDYERTWPDGEPSPGVRRMSFLHRADGISREEMSAHWSDVHAPLARVHHPAIWRYVQNTVVEPLTPGAPDIDAVAELHFRSREDLRDRFYDSDEGRRIIGEDVRRFLDPARGWRIVAQETWLKS
jgi:uncharacterized protein (TIGR02118 family)